ncbi:hypothetical protein SDC9_170955 [bioreactor metagenome]|uniref:Uncharacterized protein n=1 Tax=bioreactor metagenome TaxID=1076179 RepID=A0A645GIK6_9ZZZZ
MPRKRYRFALACLQRGFGALRIKAIVENQVLAKVLTRQLEGID